MDSRNDPLGFADRTWKNLEHVEHAYSQGSDVHVVTQLANSLLGLIIFPHERWVKAAPTELLLKDLEAEGWPQWTVELGEMDSLDDLLRHLRNATAHGRLHFDSESRLLEDVTLIAEDWSSKANKLTWKASISGPKLRTFCIFLTELLRKTKLSKKAGPG